MLLVEYFSLSAVTSDDKTDKFLQNDGIVADNDFPNILCQARRFTMGHGSSSVRSIDKFKGLSFSCRIGFENEDFKNSRYAFSLVQIPL